MIMNRQQTIKALRDAFGIDTYVALSTARHAASGGQGAQEDINEALRLWDGELIHDTLSTRLNREEAARAHLAIRFLQDMLEQGPDYAPDPADAVEAVLADSRIVVRTVRALSESLHNRLENR